MRAWVLATVAVVALAGCKAKEEAPAATATSAMQSSSMAPAAASAAPITAADLVGTWDDTMSDGSKSTTMFAADGTFHDTDAKGKVDKGKWVIKDSKVCMTGGDAKEQCWSVTAAAADGTRTATSDDGTKITVKKQA